MKNINESLSDFSSHLQTLNKPEFAGKVQKAIESKNKESLIKICRQAKIPSKYYSDVLATLLIKRSVSPQQKWPELL